MIGQNHIMSEPGSDISLKKESKILPLGIKEVSFEISGRRFKRELVDRKFVKSWRTYVHV